jgi:hypothetical protein
MQRYNLTGRVKNKPFMIIFAATENQVRKTKHFTGNHS